MSVSYPMVPGMKENGRIIRCMAKVHLLGLMVEDMKDGGMLVNNMDLELMLILVKLRLNMGYGSMESASAGMTNRLSG